MEVIPAIDLQDGRCVRLEQGDYDRMTVFANDPTAMARRWEQLGAPRLHVVDLDGASAGRAVNGLAIQSIVQAVEIPVQVGGGIRSVDAVAQLFDLGVERVILGTVALRQPNIVANAAERFPGRVVVGIDARDGFVAVQGWREVSDRLAVDLARHMVSLGVDTFIYTDISRDGMLGEPNFVATREMILTSGASIIASGGICRPEHIRRLSELGAQGAIVGRALYTGDLDLAGALAAACLPSKARPC